MKLVLLALSLVMLSACANVPALAPDAPLDPTVALIGSTKQQRSYSDYEWYSFSGADKHVLMVRDPAVTRGNVLFNAIAPGRHRIFIRILATAHSGLPGLRDDVVFVDATVEGGKAYLLTGSREGETITVWLEEEQSKAIVSDTKQILPRRNLGPIPIPL